MARPQPWLHAPLLSASTGDLRQAVDRAKEGGYIGPRSRAAAGSSGERRKGIACQMDDRRRSTRNEHCDVGDEA